MLKKVVAIGGEVGTGKTLLVRRVIEHFGFDSFTPFTYGLLRGYIRDNLIILGTYPAAPAARQDGEKPEPWGTDRLSALVLDDARNFIQSIRSIRPESAAQTVVLFEGDRLFSEHFLKPCRDESADLIVLILTAPKDVRMARGSSRGKQAKGGGWLKSNASKVYRMGRLFGARLLPNDGWKEQEENFSRLMKYLGV